MGTLRINGTIDIKQFWPTGSSDADTTKIKLVVGKNSFEYRENENTIFKPTSAFDDAISKGQGSKTVIFTSKKDGTKTITVRLQGVDAPELHYKAAPLKKSNDISDEARKEFNKINEERRQHFAESSTLALANHLMQYADNNGIIKAVFVSRVDYPFEVVDTYGRFIGNIYVGNKKDINIWLVENGWAIPTFYTSMFPDEIQMFLNAWKTGKIKSGRTGKSVTKNADTFDWTLIYRKPPVKIPFKTGDDKGKVIMPKIFRRQTAWMVSRKSGAVNDTTNLQSYLKKTPDQLVLLNDFLENGIHSAKVYSLHEFVSDHNRLLKNPEELIFKEKPGTLVNPKGKKIAVW
jgi:endonuclease YncB( thermonuclease family)